MRLRSGEHASLVAALTALAAGNSRRFQDVLWLGFGDRWTLIEGSLLQHHQIRVVDHARQTLTLTELGVALLAELNGVECRAVG